MTLDNLDGWMRAALEEAERSGAEEEVPVGAVIVRGGEIIARGRNRREARQDPLSHAELEAIRAASQTTGSWRLDDCDLVVTLEPCLMCIGAALQARVRRVVFGCRDPKAGAVRSLYTCAEDPRLNHRIEVIEGIRGEEAAQVLKSFFKKMRST